MNKKQESSGAKLMELLTEHLPEIIGREQHNENRIHLYCTGSYWVAFEKSAYQLLRICPRSQASPLSVSTYPLPVVLASITAREMCAYASKDITHNGNPNYKILPVPELSAPSYRKWHAREVEDFPTVDEELIPDTAADH